MPSSRSDLTERVETFQNMLISYANGGSVSDVEFLNLRKELIAHPELSDRLPRFVRTHRDFKQLWPFFKEVSATYNGRREYIYDAFRPLLDELENGLGSPGDARTAEVLTVFSSAAVHMAWQSALDRRSTDPGGAITSARSLMETVCKYILDGAGVKYDPAADLSKLYRLTADCLQLAPSKQTDPILRQVLGGCTTIVEGIGAMRNRLSDAHGRGHTEPQPEPRHAELAVNLAGAMATFLVEAWEKKQK